jgi:hypothetical protein
MLFIINKLGYIKINPSSSLLKISGIDRTVIYHLEQARKMRYQASASL